MKQRRLPERGSGGARSAAPSRKANYCRLVLADDWRCPAPAGLAALAGPADLAALAGPAGLDLAESALAVPAGLGQAALDPPGNNCRPPTGSSGQSRKDRPRNRTSSDTSRPDRRALGRSCRVVAAGLRASPS